MPNRNIEQSVNKNDNVIRDRVILQELIQLQKEDLSVRKQKAENEKFSIEAKANNEKANIEAQKDVAIVSIKTNSDIERQRIQDRKEERKSKNRTIIVISVLITIVLLVCVLLKESEAAFEIIKYVGLVGLAYFAGFNHGKNKYIRQAQKDVDED